MACWAHKYFPSLLQFKINSPSSSSIEYHQLTLYQIYPVSTPLESIPLISNLLLSLFFIPNTTLQTPVLANEPAPPSPSKCLLNTTVPLSLSILPAQGHRPIDRYHKYPNSNRRQSKAFPRKITAFSTSRMRQSLPLSLHRLHHRMAPTWGQPQRCRQFD
jgi:hypothetical protein